ncbi:peptide chain release factor N(5)-glutamine methyltransferase [Candidatus Thioglobus sp. NP1]|uniref:peptide chain release factor N(5)-glutamine methyltransferase n=1 Tax=Candidatus Thioglobus sp. NP1 TaxID=2508687 RepID=UPI000DEDD62E|nr:peptide chain release factor N(5)-glutamine methyltransferase [Candidatus Thioglobus sp. NP1]AXE62540.1 protein-(glutamine-N5) methyltransferase, release factor-specific [Candidatus Thioglobus sp. NP1]
MSVRKSIKDYLKEDIEDISKLLSLALKKSKEQLFSNPNYELNNIELNALDNLIEQRNDGKPFAYLKGSQGFYDLDFIVSSATLIPRPETELLIDITLDTFDINSKINALDLGTGSGVIAITLSEKYLNWSISATDQSMAALKIAQLNTDKNINFYHGNWFDPLPKEKFDLIVSNPPYINDHDPHLKSLGYEPIEALISGSDGLDDIRKIILQAPQFLNQAGYLLLEHGYNQKNHIIDLLKESFENIKAFKDINKIDRAILAQLR